MEKNINEENYNIIKNEYIPLLEQKLDRLMKYETSIIYEGEKIEPQDYFIICLIKNGLLDENNPNENIIKDLKEFGEYDEYTHKKEKILPGDIWKWLCYQDPKKIHKVIDEFLFEVTIQEAQNLWKNIQQMINDIKNILNNLKDIVSKEEFDRIFRESQEFLIIQVNIHEFIKINLENVGFMDQDYTLIYDIYDLISKPNSHHVNPIKRQEITYEFMDLLCKNLIRRRDAIFSYLNTLKELQKEKEGEEDISLKKTMRIKKYFE